MSGARGKRPHDRTDECGKVLVAHGDGIVVRRTCKHHAGADHGSLHEIPGTDARASVRRRRVPLARTSITRSGSRTAAAAAIVLHSLFEEQIALRDTGRVHQMDPDDLRFAAELAAYPGEHDYGLDPSATSITCAA